MALTYVKESHRQDGKLFECVVCPHCFGENLSEALQIAHDFDRAGYKVEHRPWSGEDRECTYCDTRHSDPERGENYHIEADDQHDAEDDR